jgi:hypothetical protein
MALERYVGIKVIRNALLHLNTKLSEPERVVSALAGAADSRTLLLRRLLPHLLSDRGQLFGAAGMDGRRHSTNIHQN